MVAIAHKNADRYVRHPARTHFLFLVFGADQGLISERARQLLQRPSSESSHAPRTVRLTGDAIAADPQTLLNEFDAPTLFDNGSADIRIVLGARSILPALELISKNQPKDQRVVVEGGALKRSAPIRKWFEAQPFAAAIESYPDQTKDLSLLLTEELRTAGLSIEPDARELLTGLLGEDRLLTRSEIQKLLLYVHGKKDITINDVTDILLNATVANLDAIISNSMSGNPITTIELSGHAAQHALDPNAVASNAIRYLLALHRLHGELAQGGSSVDGILDAGFANLHVFGRKHEVTKHIKHNSAVKLEKIIAIIYDILKNTRKAPILTEERVYRLLFNLARTNESPVKNAVQAAMG